MFGSRVNVCSKRANTVQRAVRGDIGMAGGGFVGPGGGLAWCGGKIML